MTDKEKTRLWAKGRLFEVMNGIGEQDAKSVLTDLLSFVGSDLESDLTHSVTKISDQEIPISDDIEKEADICWDYVFSALGWDENSLMTMNHKEFLAFASHFADWQKKQMESYRIKHFNNITNEQAELESDFVSKHVEKNNRMPTFLDAIEYGMELKKQQMMKDMPKWKPAARAYLGDRLPRMDYSLNRIVAREENGAYYLTMEDLYKLPKEE